MGKVLISILAAMVFALVLTVACSDDDDSSNGAATTDGNGAATTDGDGATPASSVCDQKEALDQSVDDLENLDVTASGTDGLTAALEAVATDLEELVQTASADIQPEVEALETAVNDADETLSGIEDDATLNQEIDAVQEALTGIGTAAAALGESLQNVCP